jgi:protease I
MAITNATPAVTRTARHGILRPNSTARPRSGSVTPCDVWRYTRTGPVVPVTATGSPRVAEDARRSVRDTSRSAVHARATRSVGRWSASLISATSTGVNAAAIHVPAIHSCEVTAAAVADATLAIVSVRVLRRRSSSRSAERAGGMRPGRVAMHSFTHLHARYVRAMGRLDDKKVAFLATNGVEQVELTEPWKKVEEEGGTPELVSLESGEIQAFEHLDHGDTFQVDRTVQEANEADYDGLVLPGGVANPDFLRGDEDAVAFVRAFFDAQKPVAVICHGPWTLVEADVVRDRTITSWPTIRTDIRNAGGNWVDEEVVVDNGLVSSRKPDDLPAFCDKLAEEICEGRHASTSAS